MAQQFANLLGAFLNWIPKLVLAIIIFLVGWLVSWIIEEIIFTILDRSGVNKKFNDLPYQNFARRITDNPARTISRFVYWLLIIITLSIVIGALNIPVFSGLVFKVYNYVPNILAAILILLAAIALSIFLNNVLNRWLGDTATGKIAASALPAVIMSIAIFAILIQLNIATGIVLATYIAIIGSFSLGFALAFGLGGKDIAGNILNEAYRNRFRYYNRVQSDVQKGVERAREDKERIKRRYK